jgi:hypothetical protein
MFNNSSIFWVLLDSGSNPRLALANLGRFAQTDCFFLTIQDESNSHFILFEFTKVARTAKTEQEWTLLLSKGEVLKPCEYKRRWFDASVKSFGNMETRYSTSDSTPHLLILNYTMNFRGKIIITSTKIDIEVFPDDDRLYKVTTGKIKFSTS